MSGRRTAWLGLVALCACSSSSVAPDGAAGAAGQPSGTAGGAGGAGPAGASGDAGAVGTGVTPGPFTQTLPANGTITASVPTDFSWTASSDARSYVVEVSTSPDFGPGSVVKLPPVTILFARTSQLRKGVVYFWRVTASNGSLTTLGGSGFPDGAPAWFSVPLYVGNTSGGIAVTSTGTAVVANWGASTISLVDLATSKVDTIALKDNPNAVAVTPDGKTALVPRGILSSIDVVDLGSKTITRALDPRCNATTIFSIAIAADGSAAFAPDRSATCGTDALDVIPLPGASIGKAIELTGIDTLLAVAVSADARKAVVTRGSKANRLLLVDLIDGTFRESETVGASFGVAISAPYGFIYVTTAGGVQRLMDSGAKLDPLIAFPPNNSTCNIAVTPDGKYAVVVGPSKIGVLSLEVGHSTVIAELPVAGQCVAIAPEGKRAYVTNSGGVGEVFAIKLP